MYKRGWINVIFLQDEHQIHAVFSNINFCVFGAKLKKSR